MRKEFDDSLRETLPEALRNSMHWVLCLLFIAETIGAVAFITNWRIAISEDKDGTTFGMSNTLVTKLFKYLITANIKIVDFAWTSLSTYLTEKENWRTDVDLKSNMIVKLFAVKFVIFYYPFFYVIFLQPFVEGCDGGEMEGRWIWS